MEELVLFTLGCLTGLFVGKYYFSHVKRRIAHIRQIRIEDSKLIIDERPSQYSDTILEQLQSLFESNTRGIDNEDSRKVLWLYGLKHFGNLIERARHANMYEALLIRLTKSSDSSKKSV